MKVAPRTSRDRFALTFRVLTAVFFLGVLVLGYELRVVLLSFGVALLLIALAVRPRAERVRGAIYSASATQLTSTRPWSGQLSVTDSSPVWLPNSRSRRHDIAAVTITQSEAPVVEMRRDATLMEVIVTVTPSEGDDLRFRTRRSRRLRQALSALQAPHSDDRAIAG